MQLRMLLAALVLVPLCPAQTRLEKELQTPYQRVLDQDLLYIITPQERQAFNRLGADDEREQFIEQFWRRRDPTPDTEENEYREEHYRRIAYANERYASGIPGWKTDRGRIYIMYGPPDEIESHPSGGLYSIGRPGAQTSTFPFEQWRYRYLESIGTNIVIEFVDPTMTGEYRMTMDPNEKDALQHVPGHQSAVAAQAGSDAFERLKLYADLNRPPSANSRDLEATVSSRVAFNVLPMKVQQHFFRITDSSVQANITVQFDTRDLQFITKDGVRTSVINILGRITTLTRRAVSTFERTLQTEPETPASIFQEALALPPGSYRLNIIAKDMVSGTAQNYETLLTVPRFEEGKLAFSSLVIADRIEPLPARSTGTGQFAIGSMKVRPRLSATFRTEESLSFFTQIYSPSPGTLVQCEVAREDGGKEIDCSDTLSAASRTQSDFTKVLPLGVLRQGRYLLKLKTGNPAAGGAIAMAYPFLVE